MAHQRNCSACHTTQQQRPKQHLSKNVLDIRMVSGDPKGAWIECYNNTYDKNAQIGSAEYQAKIENEKLNTFFHDKKKRLKEFQHEVSRRVTSLQKLKQKEKQIHSLKLLEEEQNIVVQRTLGMKLPYRGTEQDLQALNKELLKSCIIPCALNKRLIQDEVMESNEKVNITAEKMNTESAKAKASLLSKRVKGDFTSLPGGLWSSPVKQVVSISIHPPSKQPVANGAVPDTWTGSNAIKSCVSNEKINEDDPIEYKNIDSECENSDRDEALTVHNDSIELGELQRNLVYDPINMGQQIEQEKHQKKSQYWKYRKIFMDIERDQVREGKRRQEQKKLIEKVKLAKEKERELFEEWVIEFHDQTTHEVEGHKYMDSDDKAISCVRSKQKEKELYRYIHALREVAKERTKLCKVFLAPLCQCGPSIWDAHPDTCANNCEFYKNPKGYVKALTAALANSR